MVRLDQSRAALLREIRIAALTDSPEDFGETLEAALARAEVEWCELACSAHVAEIDGRWVGMAFAFPDNSEPDTARVGGLWVAPGERRLGVGSELMQAILIWAAAEGKRRIRLWVRPASPAEALYRRARFAPTGKQKPFPGKGSGTIIEMQLEISGSG